MGARVHHTLSALPHRTIQVLRRRQQGEPCDHNWPNRTRKENARFPRNCEWLTIFQIRRHRGGRRQESPILQLTEKEGLTERFLHLIASEKRKGRIETRQGVRSLRSE